MMPGDERKRCLMNHNIHFSHINVHGNYCKQQKQNECASDVSGELFSHFESSSLHSLSLALASYPSHPIQD